MKREDFTFVHSLRVRWAEVDRQDVVFNGHYFLYFDVAVAEYWRAIGFRYPEDIGPVARADQTGNPPVRAHPARGSERLSELVNTWQRATRNKNQKSA